MLITDSFIFYQIPRTGGNKFVQLCQENIDKKIQFYHNIDSPNRFSWDTSFTEIDVTLYDYVIGFRKLPQWIMSHNISQHYEQFTLQNADIKKWKDIKDKTVNGLITNNGTDWVTVDSVYQDKFDIILDDLRKVTIIRQEHLLEDFSTLLNKYYKLNDKPILNPKKKNETSLVPRFLLSEKDIKKIYRVNPKWKELEKYIYGS